jgi:hypothetical protein
MQMATYQIKVWHISAQSVVTLVFSYQDQLNYKIYLHNTYFLLREKQ